MNLKKCLFQDVVMLLRVIRHLQTQLATQQSLFKNNEDWCTLVSVSLIDFFLGHFTVLRVRWRSEKRGQC